MSLLSMYRIRIKNLLAADDIQQALLLEGIDPVKAVAIANSKAVIAQRSLIRRETLKITLDNPIPEETEGD